jgi:hypothetical protein
MMLPRRGRARTAQKAEEIRFADIESILSEDGADVRQGGSAAAKLTGSLVNSIAFGGRLGAGLGGREKRVDVWVASEVADDGSYRAGVKMKPLGDLIGGCGFVKVGAADLVAPVDRRIRLLEQVREFLGAGHWSWVPLGKLPAPEGHPGSRLVPGVTDGHCGRKARNEGVSAESAVE